MKKRALSRILAKVKFSIICSENGLISETFIIPLIDMPYRLRLEFSGGVRAVCELEDSPELEKLLRESPFTAEANRWGDEIYFDLPVKLRFKGERTLMEVGEVAYWPEGNSLCLFFGPTPISKGDKPVAYSKVKPLGRVVEGLKDLRKVKDGEEIRAEITRE